MSSYTCCSTAALVSFTTRLCVQEEPHHYECVTSVCKEKLPVEAEQEKPCLNITGELENMKVKPTQLYCAVPMEAAPPGKNSWVMFYPGSKHDSVWICDVMNEFYHQDFDSFVSKNVKLTAVDTMRCLLATRWNFYKKLKNIIWSIPPDCTALSLRLVFSLWTCRSDSQKSIKSYKYLGSQ